MNKLGRLLLIAAFFLPACSGSGVTTLDVDQTGDVVDAADLARQGTEVVLPDGQFEVLQDLGLDLQPLPDLLAELPFETVSGQLGSPCNFADDCASGLCIETGAGSVCTDTCIEECPDSWQCKGVNLFGSDLTFVCVPTHWAICSPCLSDDHCEADSGVCMGIGDEGSYCLVPCLDGDCPDGYVCTAETLCLPETGSCICRGVPYEGAVKECTLNNEFGECPGEATCLGGEGWSDCEGDVPEEESCDGKDNNCDGVVDEGFEDHDLDGLKDCADADDDGDGVLDMQDNCPLVANAGQENLDGDEMGDVCDPDDDNDTVNDEVDNCPLDSNVNQEDTDGDLTGDACDADDDEDGVPDLTDNCPLMANSQQADNDGDNLGDPCDTDDDNDGVDDLVDNCPMEANTAQDNCDQDVSGDACDPDDDNDGVPDETDCADCDASVYPGATEACNGIDDNCNSLTDEETEAECGDYECAGEAGCLAACSSQDDCAQEAFCDVNDVDGNGKTDQCIAQQSSGTACSDDFECVDDYCSNGFCCGAVGEICCALDGDCSSLTTPPTCDSPAGCSGHRMEGYCNQANVCKAQQVTDHSACAGSLCLSGKHCVGAAVHESKFCDASGGCTANGSLVQNCQGANPCCNYGCGNGACNSAFSGTPECALACFMQPILCLCF